jgi:hypothetical protein
MNKSIIVAGMVSAFVRLASLSEVTQPLHDARGRVSRPNSLESQTVEKSDGAECH